MSPKAKIALIGAVCAAPIVLGWAAYLLHWTPGDAGNYGELLAPQPVSAPAVTALRGKWVLLTVDAGACDSYCEKKLYFLRQVRRAQGKDMERIERLWVITDSGQPRPELLAAIEGTHLARFNDRAFSSDYVYLVDPLGNLMLRFPRDPDPSRMIKDLQRLLKLSRIG